MHFTVCDLALAMASTYATICVTVSIKDEVPILLEIVFLPGFGILLHPYTIGNGIDRALPLMC